MEKNKITYKEIGGSVGLAAGYLWSYKKGKSFWGIVGFGILGSIAGSVIGSLIDKKDNDGK